MNFADPLPHLSTESRQTVVDFGQSVSYQLEGSFGSLHGTFF
jgi:hypothetical protein